MVSAVSVSVATGGDRRLLCPVIAPRPDSRPSWTQAAFASAAGYVTVKAEGTRRANHAAKAGSISRDNPKRIARIRVRFAFDEGGREACDPAGGRHGAA
mgnify:CR=1 FL=1